MIHHSLFTNNNCRMLKFSL